MRRSSSSDLNDISSNAGDCRRPSLGTLATGCCYSVVDFSDDYDDYYHPVQKSFTTSEKDEELGLIEDHFSRPEGIFGFSTIEELEMEIQHCKDMIMAIPEKTDRKRQLIKKLVQLRLKYQDVKDSPDTPPEVNIVLGHNFELGNVETLEKLQQYCEKCCNIIWGVFHKWYRCKYCGFKCHNKCINVVTRICAHTKAQENPSYVLDICPEVGLREQKYRCADCKRKFNFKESERLPRTCDYNGLSYCSFCHWNSSAIIPARVIHNWDFTPQKVCRASIQFLRIMSRKPIFNVESLNSMLFVFVTDLNIIKKLRHDILVMKKYFLTCHAASKEKLLLQLKDRQHFVENADMYSLKDLIDLQSGQLLIYVQNVYTVFYKHITEECQGCKGKGFFCELCKSEEVLFPFYKQIDSCSKCNSLFHQECFTKSDGCCPKCVRKAKQSDLDK